jgi:hypothetical protein
MASRSSSGNSISLRGYQCESEHSVKQKKANGIEDLQFYADKCKERTVVGHVHLCIFLQVGKGSIRLPRFPVHLLLRLRRLSRQSIFETTTAQCKQNQRAQHTSLSSPAVYGA